jgi:hypothetical protein
VILNYDSREAGITTDNKTLAFSSKTIYKMNFKDSNHFSFDTMRVHGEHYNSKFKLSNVFEALMKRMKEKKLKQNIVYIIHILGCMVIK